MTRVAWALLVAMLATFVAACGGSDALTPEDLRDGAGIEATNDYLEEPGYLRAKLLIDPWVSNLRVGDGSRFGAEVPRMVRIDIDGSGPLARRDVTLQTQPSVKMFTGAAEGRMRHALHGALAQLDEREGFIRGLTISTSRDNYEAAALAGMIEEFSIDGTLSPADRRLATALLGYYASETAYNSYAWYDPRTTWVALGPDVSRVLSKYAATGKVSPAEGIRAAKVLRHEFEHSVSPAKGVEGHKRWFEEGSADVLARWPGSATTMAKAMGLPYPKRYERVAYEEYFGYRDWVKSIRLLLQAAGIDPTRPSDFARASDILQSEPVPRSLDALATAIIEEQGLSPARAKLLRRQLRALDGDTSDTRRLVASWI